MSSSGARRSRTIFFYVQSGVVAFEEPEPLADWRWKTVTVCARELSRLVALLWNIVALRPPGLPNVFAVHIAPLPIGIGTVKKRQILEPLHRDPPGFRGTHVVVGGEHACVASALADHQKADVNRLTDYRRSILIEASGEATSDSVVDLICEMVTAFDNDAIGALLDRRKEWGLLRILDRGTHAAVQVIGSAAVTEGAVRSLAAQRVHQLRDVRSLRTAIASLRTG